MFLSSSSSMPLFGKLEKQIKEFRHRLEELGSLRDMGCGDGDRFNHSTHICQPSSRSIVFLYCWKRIFKVDKSEDKKLALVKTPNAENPLVLNYTGNRGDQI